MGARGAMGATGDVEQPRGPGGAERGGPELGDAGAAGQLVLTVRAPPGRPRPGLGSGRAGPRAPGTLARGGENAAADLPRGLALSQSDDLASNSGAALLKLGDVGRPCQAPEPQFYLQEDGDA